MVTLANGHVPVLKRYLTGSDGQIHIREAGPHGVRPVACLHATAYSSRTFVALLKLLGTDRHAIAVDTPGYGESDPPESLLDIAGYAASIAEALATEHRSVDLVGYHTGVSIAVEMAIRYPQLVRRLVLIGIPYFRALDFGHWRGKLASQHELTADLAQFDERWDFLVTGRPPGIPLETGFRNFVDELKAWPNGTRAHAALFDHDLDARLPLIGQPVLVLNPAGHLAMPSRTAAQLIPDAEVVEMPEHSGAVLETAAEPIGARIVAFLDRALVGA